MVLCAWAGNRGMEGRRGCAGEAKEAGEGGNLELGADELRSLAGRRSGLFGQLREARQGQLKSRGKEAKRRTRGEMGLLLSANSLPGW